MNNIDVFNALYQAVLRDPKGHSRGTVTVIGNRSFLVDNPVLVVDEVDGSPIMAEITMFYSPLGPKSWKDTRVTTAVMTVLKADVYDDEENAQPENHRLSHVTLMVVPGDTETPWTIEFNVVDTGGGDPCYHFLSFSWNPDGTMNVTPGEIHELGKFMREPLW